MREAVLWTAYVVRKKGDQVLDHSLASLGVFGGLGDALGTVLALVRAPSYGSSWYDALNIALYMYCLLGCLSERAMLAQAHGQNRAKEHAKTLTMSREKQHPPHRWLF